MEKAKRDPALETEALITVGEIFSCSECMAKNSLCEKHSKSIKKIIIQESKKDQN